MRFRKVDVKSGAFSFGERIEIGHIMTSEDDPYVKAVFVFKTLHGFRPNWLAVQLLNRYILSIFEGLKYWLEAEKNLKYTPTPEEAEAGIEDFSKKIGEVGTVTELAEKFGKDPDVILRWDYAKVYGIMYAALEKYKFQKKVQKIVERQNG